MTALIAHVPTLYPDESLSSFLLRLAKNHSASGHELCYLLWPDHQFWTRDIDRTAPDELLRSIASITGRDETELRSATLRGLIQVMGFQESIYTYQPGILPVGIYHRIRRRFGQQYCPACLTDGPPYLRRIWRSEFVVGCERHGIRLRDACPTCDTPFIPHRNRAFASLRCHVCESSLLDPSPSIHPKARAVQSLIAKAMGIVKEKSGAKNDGMHFPPAITDVCSTTPTELIDGVRRLCRLATRHTEFSSADAPQPGKRIWQYLRTTEREAILAQVGEWLASWPDRWIEWSNVADLTQHHLNDEYGPWQAWCASALSALPFSHGPVDIRRHRGVISLRQMRRRFGMSPAYQQSRARLLLKQIGA